MIKNERIFFYKVLEWLNDLTNDCPIVWKVWFGERERDINVVTEEHWRGDPTTGGFFRSTQWLITAFLLKVCQRLFANQWYLQ